MKELSIEEKAKRFDEAIEVARKIKNGEPIDVPDGTPVPVAIFPELIESENENERIRKELIGYFTGWSDERLFRGFKAEQILTWLKKQGEKIILPKFTYDDVLALQCAMGAAKEVQNNEDLYDLYEQLRSLHDRVHDAYWIEKQGEQKPVEPQQDMLSQEKYAKAVDECVYGEQKPIDKVEPKFKVGDTIKCKYDDRQFTIKSVDLDKGTYTYTQEGRGNDIDYADEKFELVEQKSIHDVEIPFGAIDSELKEASYHIPNGYHAEIEDNKVIIKKGEQKPAWNEEDKMMLQYAIEHFERQKRNYTEGGDGKKAMQEFIDWLKSLRPQNKCTYNPYKEVVESISEMCKHYVKASPRGLQDFYDNVRIKCKDAKEYDSLFPQSSWKPSEIEIKVLEDVIDSRVNPINYHATLHGILERLKKLREE